MSSASRKLLDRGIIALPRLLKTPPKRPAPFCGPRHIHCQGLTYGFHRSLLSLVGALKTYSTESARTKLLFEEPSVLDCNLTEAQTGVSSVGSVENMISVESSVKLVIFQDVIHSLKLVQPTNSEAPYGPADFAIKKRLSLKKDSTSA
jgi:hypothetical protein